MTQDADHDRRWHAALTPYIERDNYDLSDFIPEVLDIYTIDGKVYGLPMLTTGSFIFYHRDLFDAAGVEYPPTDWDDISWTHDAFVEKCGQLTSNTDDPEMAVFGCNLGFWPNDAYAWLYGQDLYLDSTYQTGFASEAYLDSDAAVETVEEFIANSQAYQANLVQFAAESYRRAKYDPMQGIFHFMFVDDWPSITWSVLDYDRQPKAGFYALQTAMQPILPSVNATLPERLEGRRWVYSAPDRITISLSVVNDTLDTYLDAQLRWRIKDGDDRVVMSDTVRVNVRADESRSATSLRPSHLTPGNYCLSVELNDTQGQLLGQNAFEFAILSEEQQ